ncbi:MAG: NYN domain-containing protein [Candidatus Dormibacteria bacterium]
MPENTGKVALFVDFDNIRIGIRQHFSSPQRNAEIHPGKLMSKASTYGRVVSAKAYADFTGHPKEFQDKLLFAAGIEPIHAPSKISGGRRQSSADMHMVIDMFLEAIDHEDIDTFVLMTGDADFVRMVATLRRRFGRKVIISGVQSTSTSLDLMNAADGRDPITRQDVDLTGELGPMTRPLVTRADLEANVATAAANEAAVQERSRGGLFGGLFRRKKQDSAPQAGRAAATPVAPLQPPPPPAPRRMRASELRPSSGTSRGSSSGRTQNAGTTQPGAPSRRGASTPRAATSNRGRQAEELPAVTPSSEPDEVERNIIREIHLMPPGRMGYSTIKTIEETLRSKAGAMGATRKEIPSRLDRLATMGIFKRGSRPRGTGEVETGVLVADHPIVAALTSGLEKPAPKEPRPPRAPRRERGTRLVTGSTGEEPDEGGSPAEDSPVPAAEQPAVAAAEVAAEAPPPGPTDEVAAEPSAPADEPAEPFRWVSGGAAETTTPTPEAPVEATPEAKPATRAKRAPAAKKPAAPRRKAATPRAPRKKTEPGAPEAADSAASDGVTPAEPPPG